MRLAYLFAFRNSDRTVSFEESVVDTELETLATVSDIDNDIYDRLAHHWWDPTKAFSAGLHAMTRLRAPVFLNYFETVQGSLDKRQQLCIVDVGCGGGILAEALVCEAKKRGCCEVSLIGVDLAAGAVRAAHEHAQETFGPSSVAENGRSDEGVSINYRVGNATRLSSAVAEHSADMLVIADVLEHVLDLPSVMREISRVLKPGGVLVFDTVNRTSLSYIIAILLAQEVPFLSLLPSHTHDWALFLRPDELKQLCEANRLQLKFIEGFRPSLDASLLRGLLFRSSLHRMSFTTSPDPSVQYLGYAVKSL